MRTVKQNSIIAIASGKGGVGKTWLSITLTHLLARSGRRVLLFDGDIGLANVDVQLGISPALDLSNVLSGRNTLKEVITPYKEGGFDIIAGRSGSATLANLPEEKLALLGDGLKALRNDYDFVLIDLGAGIEHHVQYLAALADKCVVVLTDEPTSLTDAYAFIKVMLQSKPDLAVSVVINQASTQKEGDATYQAINKACTNFLHMSPPLLGVIRKDNKVKDAIRHQSSLVIRSPQTTAATDVAALSIKLLNHS